MKKMKKLISIFGIVLFGSMIIGCAACKKKPVENPDPQSGYVQTITLKNEQLIVGLYMTDTIEYQGEGVATYSSDNPEIVSVDETGKVTGLKVGKANVTVAIGESKAVCEVTVVDTNETPYIKLSLSDSEYNLLVDDYILLNAKLVFQQEERSEKITYESDNDCVVIDENGKLTAKKAGTATVTVSAEFFDQTITKVLKINVLNSPVVLNTTTSNYVVYTNSSKGNNDSVTLPNSVIVDSQVTPVEFTYTYDNNKLLNEGNVFKAKLPCVRDEVVEVQMSYTNSEQETYTFTIEVQIKLVNENLEGTTSLAIENGKSQAITGRGITLVYDENEIPDEIIAVHENGIDLQYNTDTKEIESPLDTSGRTKWDLITENGIVYNVPVEFYDVVLYDGDDVKQILPKVTSQYVVLGNDIEKVESYKGSYKTVTGTLDGRGYSIKSITYSGYDSFLLGYFEGTIKNISFDDMLLADRQFGIADGAKTCRLENVFINARYEMRNGDNSVAALFKEIWGGHTVTLENVVVLFNAPSTLSVKYSLFAPTSETTDAAINNSTITGTNVYTSGTCNGGNMAFAPERALGIISGCEYKTEAELLEMARNNQLATDMLTNKILANIVNTVDKTATQNYYVENWTTTGVTLTNDHTPKFTANANLSDNGSTTIQKITANGIDLGYNAETGALDASKLTKGAAIWNIHYSDIEIYKVTVTVVDAIIKDATDFKEIVPNVKTEYIVLGNDIDLVTGYTVGYKTFSGTFDGRGYSVKEIKYSGWDTALFGYFNGTLKNISFDRMRLINAQFGIARATYSCTLDNVFINAYYDTMNGDEKVAALFKEIWGSPTITLRNVVVIFDDAVGEKYSIAYPSSESPQDQVANAQIKGTNVYIAGVYGTNKTAMPMVPTALTNVTGCTQKTKAELLQMANDGDTTLTAMAQTAIQKALGTN